MNTYNSIWVVTTDNKIFGYNTKFFSTKEKAQNCLKGIAKERRNNPSADVVTDTDIEFTFILGWEEVSVSFKVKEIFLDVG